MSERVERKLLKILGNPVESPYGNPIPGLEELGVDTSRVPKDVEVVPVTSLLDRTVTSVTATILRLAEPAQVDPELLTQLGESGIIPGSVATFSEREEYVHVKVEGIEGGLELRPEVAAFIFVAKP